MHKTRTNALSLELHLRPKGPLLIKAGGLSADPTLPDMQFVRTVHPEKGEILYIPGSSLKGVVRGFVEKVLRTINEPPPSWRRACSTFPSEKDSCAREQQGEEKSTAIYHRSCGACRIFGHTRLKGRASFTDLFPLDGVKTETRYGVAISRLSHAVAQGPFEMEVAVAGTFQGHLVLENFEIWQLGLLALAIESMNHGLLKVGFGKNRGFGEVKVVVQEARLDELARGIDAGVWRGLAAFVSEEEKSAYGLQGPTHLRGMPDPAKTENLVFYLRRIYGADHWKTIAQKAVEALSAG